MVEEEKCGNPWARRPCGRRDIAVYIIVNGEKIPICHECWRRIANSNREWGEEPGLGRR